MRALLLAVLFSFAAVQAQPRRGDAAPDPGAEAFLNAPDGAAWADTFGQAVVLDFWATWCGPCVSAIPHLNALADRFAGRPVRFVSLTAESAEAVRPFLAQHPIRGWVGLDTDSTGAAAYGVTGIPQTALIGRDGRLAAIVHPTEITAATLDSLLAGFDLDRPDVARPPFSRDSLMARVERYRATPAPSTRVSDVRWMNPGEHPPVYERFGPSIDAERRDAIWDGPLELLLRYSPASGSLGEGGFPDLARVVGPDSLVGRSASFRITAPDVPEADFRRHVFETVGAALGITIRDAVQPTPILLLRQSEGGMSLKPSTASTRSSGRNGAISARGATLGDIARALESCLETPVLDETGVEGAYDLQLLMDPAAVHCDRPDDAQTAAVREALRETAGLDLVPDTQTLPVIVVEPRP